MMDHIKLRKERLEREKIKKAGILKANIIKDAALVPKDANILLDTNVIYWMTYANSRSMPQKLKPQPYQLNDYPSLVDKFLGVNNLRYSRFSIPELFHIVANTEARLDSVTNNYEHKKWMRQKGRDIVSKEMSSVMEALNNFSKIIDPNIDTLLDPETYLNIYEDVYMDGYDIFLKNEMDVNRINYILSDDADYSTIANLNLITANKSI